MRNPGWSVLVIGVLLGGCTVFNPVMEIRTQTVIDAPVEAVWDVLVDADRYGDWNSYHRNLRAPDGFQVGETFLTDIHRPDGRVIDDLEPTILVLDEPFELTWGGGIPFLWQGIHSFRLEATEDGRTILHHDEDFSGWATLVTFDYEADGAMFHAAYRAVNEAVKGAVGARQICPRCGQAETHHPE